MSLPSDHTATARAQSRETPLSTHENAATGAISAESEQSLGENTEQTVRRVLSNYSLGPKLKHLRLRKKIALVDLGKQTGLSASMLSQLENGKLIPTLPTLARIAMVFDVGLDYFFSERKEKKIFSIVRAGERMKFPEAPESPIPGYFFEVLAFGITDKVLSAYLAEFPDRGNHPSHEHTHEGFEFIHVINGELGIHYQAEDHVLGPGDSVYFDASEPHFYVGHSDPPAKALIVTAPGHY